MPEVNQVLIWTFFQQCSVPEDVMSMLVKDEVPVNAFKTIRDVAVFTNKRIIVKDSQGLTGKKIEIYSLPYSSVLMWSTENSGKLLDMNAEVELWTRAGHIKINLKRDIDIRQFDKLLAEYIL